MKTSSSKHSKKRNVGLLYEFLVRLISKSLVEGDQQKSTDALQTLKRFFKPESELYKEFRLLHALMKTEVSNTTVAASIIAEAKNASRQHDSEKLDREKSFLIKHINHKLNEDGTFWDQPIAEYRMLATVQTLINDWRLGDGVAMQRVAQYEDQLTKWLTEARVKPQVHEELTGTPGENRLVFKLMMKKLNEKYSLALSNDQRSILKEYVFMVTTDRDVTNLRNKLQELRTSALKSLNGYMASTSLNTYMQEKLTETRDAIEAETLQEIDDSTITKFMLYMKLISELDSKE